MTTATLRPNATISTGGATFTGGVGNWHGNTSDDLDTSYAELPAGGSANLNLTTVTLPSGAVTKTVTARMRARSASGTSSCAAWITYSTGILIVKVSASPTTTITSYTGSPQAVTLTQAQIDALRLAPTSPTGATRFMELYVDLVYATKPTTTVTAPTGTIGTNQPTVEFTHTPGSDGGPQTHYQVRVFTAAQYGIGGFSPDTSPNTYDSGDIPSAGSSFVLYNPPLNNLTTYRAYVRTAQTINGSSQWADWAFTQFDVSVTPPTITSVAVTPSNTTGSIAVQVNRNTGGPAWDHVTVERSDDGGTTWKFVRGATYATASGNTFNVTDYEAANGTTVTYRAQASLGVPGAAATSPLVSSSTTSWSSTLTFLKAQVSSLNMTITVVELPTRNRERRAGVFQVLGRENPVVVSDVLNGTTGDLIVRTSTAADTAKMLALLEATQPLLVQFPPTRYLEDMWAVVTAENHVPTLKLSPMRNWTLTLVEVDRPPDTQSV